MTPYYEDSSCTIYHANAVAVLGEILDQADVMVTDPPYGMSFKSGHPGRHEGESVAGDSSVQARDSVLDHWGQRPALVMGRWSVSRPAGTRMVLTWDKGEHTGMGDLSLPWKPTTEEIYVLGTGFAGRRSGSVLKFNAVAGCVGSRNSGQRFHVTEKPVELMRALVGKCPDGVVIDPFMGSGTTLRAAKDMGRRSVGIEIEERYCEVAAKRMGQEVLFK